MHANTSHKLKLPIPGQVKHMVRYLEHGPEQPLGHLCGHIFGHAFFEHGDLGDSLRSPYLTMSSIAEQTSRVTPDWL